MYMYTHLISTATQQEEVNDHLQPDFGLFYCRENLSEPTFGLLQHQRMLPASMYLQYSQTACKINPQTLQIADQAESL